MATRGYLKYKPHGSIPGASSLASLAAAASTQMIANEHGYAQHRGNSLLTSYRLLDVLAYHLNCHDGVVRHPASKPEAFHDKNPYLLKVR